MRPCYCRNPGKLALGPGLAKAMPLSFLSSSNTLSTVASMADFLSIPDRQILSLSLAGLLTIRHGTYPPVTHWYFPTSLSTLPSLPPKTLSICFQVLIFWINRTCPLAGKVLLVWIIHGTTIPTSARTTHPALAMDGHTGTAFSSKSVVQAVPCSARPTATRWLQRSSPSLLPTNFILSTPPQRNGRHPWKSSTGWLTSCAIMRFP